MSDSELAQLVADGRAVGVEGGDLFRAVGSPGRRSVMQRVSVDALDVVVDGRPAVAVAHVIARHSWWSGQIVAICNVGHVGAWNVAPRAHPNDGRVDIVEVDAAMSRRARWQARSRLRTGTHLPHPDLRVRSARSAVWEFVRPLKVWIDGVPSGDARHLEVLVRPDAFELYL